MLIICAGGLQDAAVLAALGEEPLVCILAVDGSRGADGIVAASDIETIADLAGRSVGVQRGGIPHFYLNFVLREAGLGESDIEVVDLSGEDAAQAFLLGDVDAAVTYEPWLTQGKEAGYGHLLTERAAGPPGRLPDHPPRHLDRAPGGLPGAGAGAGCRGAFARP